MLFGIDFLSKSLGINLASTAIGLIVGMLLRTWVFTDSKLTVKDLKAFIPYTLVLGFLTVQGTFSAWDILSIEYAGMGLIGPVFAKPIYNLLVAVAPALLQFLLPAGLQKLWENLKSQQTKNEDDTHV